jgi:hypothetical protein
MKKYMIPNHTRSGVVKANPKMHKQEMPMRTIVSAIDHPTEKIAEVAERELQEWVEQLPSYIKDTTDFLKKLESVKCCIPQDATLFTMDVKALYPSIPIQETLEACREALDNRKQPDIPTDAIMEMVKMVLENNTFSFNDQNYIQTDGTAIGSKLGKNLACTYMGVWEKVLLQMATQKPILYLRFVDDIIGIWDGSKKELLNFQDIANQIHPRIKVEMKMSQTEIEFLDTKVRKENGKLETTIYAKPTDKHMYLHKDSDHPKTTKKAIPYGLGIRAKRICSTESEYQKNRNAIMCNLQNRGYKRTEVNKTLNKVDVLDRHDLLEYNCKHNKTGDKRVPLVLTYGENLPNIQNIVHQRMDVLHRSYRMKKIFGEAPLTAYRRDANLGDVLVHSKYNRIFTPGPEGTSKCVKNCVICQHMKVGTEHTRLGHTYCFKDKISCKTTNCIYGIYCDVCEDIVYVGETGTSLYERFQNHLTSVRKQKDEPIPNHFNQGSHKMKDLMIVGIQGLGNKDIHYRKVRESFWIKKMGTLQPNGRNQNLGISDNSRIA